MQRLYFPFLSFQPGENITVRLGVEHADRFDAGEMAAEILQLGSEQVYAVADLHQVTRMPFNMIPEEWIVRAAYAGAQTLDDVYVMLSDAYGVQFDSEMLVSVIFFTVRS